MHVREFIDVRAILVIANDMIPRRIDPGRNHRAVDFGSARVSGMMFGESGALLRKLEQRRAIRRRDKIRSHAVPKNQDDVFGSMNLKAQRRQESRQENFASFSNVLSAY